MTQAGTPIHPDLDAEARRLIAELERLDLHARLIGGMAVRFVPVSR